MNFPEMACAGERTGSKRPLDSAALDLNSSVRARKEARPQYEVVAFFASDTPRAGFGLLEDDLPQVAFSSVIAPDREQLEAHGLDNGPDSRNGVYVIRKTDDECVDPVVLVGGLGELRQRLYRDIQMPGYGRHT